jgi:hypothetical protein
MFAVWTPGDDRWDRPLVCRAVDIDVEFDAIPQRHREITLDDHRVFVLDSTAIDRRRAAALLRGVAGAAIAILEGLCWHVISSSESGVRHQQSGS